MMRPGALKATSSRDTWHIYPFFQHGNDVLPSHEPCESLNSRNALGIACKSRLVDRSGKLRKDQNVTSGSLSLVVVGQTLNEPSSQPGNRMRSYQGRAILAPCPNRYSLQRNVVPFRVAEQILARRSMWSIWARLHY